MKKYVHLILDFAVCKYPNLNSAYKPGAYYNVVGCISLRMYKQPSVATKNGTGDSTGVNT